MKLSKKTPHYHDPMFISPDLSDFQNAPHTGNEFRIVTHGNTPENIYIQKVKLNGRALDTFWFPHTEFANGGLLEIRLGPEPTQSWGRR